MTFILCPAGCIGDCKNPPGLLHDAGKFCIAAFLDEAQNIPDQVVDLRRSRQEAIVLAKQMHYALAYYSCCDATNRTSWARRDDVVFFHLYAGEIIKMSFSMSVWQSVLVYTILHAFSMCLQHFSASKSLRAHWSQVVHLHPFAALST